MRAVVLSGGGSKGAWMTGVLQHLLGDKQIKYDILCGVSVGAIIAAFIAQFPIGNEFEASSKLYEMWRGMDNSKVYKRRFPFGKFHALFNDSFFDSSPLRKLLNENINIDLIRSSGKKVNVGTVSLSTGKYTIFDETSDHFINAVLASASFPGMLESVKFLDQLWTDGGIKELSPLKQAIELGATEIDVIITSPENRIKRFSEKPNTIDVLKRAMDLSTDKIMANDIEKVEMHNKLAAAGIGNKKHVKLNIYRPKYNLIEDLLDFSPNKIKIMLENGYKDCIDIK